MNRLILGFLVAPIAPVIMVVALTLIVTRQLTDAGPFLVIGTFYVYPAAILFGMPLYLYAKAKGTFTVRRTIVIAASIGAVIGVVVGASFVPVAPPGAVIRLTALLAFIGGSLGMMSGMCFWDLAGRGAQRRSNGP